MRILGVIGQYVIQRVVNLSLPKNEPFIFLLLYHSKVLLLPCQGFCWHS